MNNNLTPADITIHKLIAKGKDNETQTLLVLGTSNVEHPIWVRFGEKNPNGILDFQNWGKIERATFFNSPEIEYLDENFKNCKEQDTNYQPLGVPLGKDEKFWLARFDFPDHTGDSPNHKGLEQRWLDLNENSKKNEPAVPFHVMASHHELVILNGSNKSSELIIESFELKKVIHIPLFEVGVLFVHGIGEHKVRETLIQFGEPFVEFWKGWLKQSTIFSKSHFNESGRKELEEYVEKGVLKNRQDQRVQDILLDVFAEHTEQAKHDAHQTPKQNKSQFVCAGLHVEDTLFKDSDTVKPTSSLLRFMLLKEENPNPKKGYGLKEAHVLMTEAFWTNETVYPTSIELLIWITKALPLSTCMQISFLGRSILKECSDSKIGLLLVLYRLLAFPIKAPLTLILAIIIQPLLFVAAIVGLVPISWIRGIANWIFNVLTNTIGQSYALKMSVIRRNAIMRRVMKDLEWMNQRCQKIVVISHSQGAEITRLVLGMQRWPKIKRWVTAGAGIVPLTFLDKSHSLPIVAKVMEIILVSSTIIILLISAYFLLNINMVDFISLFNDLRSLGTGYLISFYILLLFLCIMVAVCFQKQNPKVEPGVHEDTQKVWHNYYGTDDPVSCGSIEDFYAGLPEKTHHSDDWTKCIPTGSNRIFNTLSLLNDHTSYFQNTGQFIAPLALEIAEMAGFNIVDKANKEELLEQSCKREKIFVVIWMIIRYTFIFAFIYFTWQAAWGESGNWSNWLECIKNAWEAPQGCPSSMKEKCGISTFLQELKGPILVLVIYTIVKFLWRIFYENCFRPKSLHKDLEGVLLNE